ncbi:MAG: UDP-N-acetylmuramoyl-tripeptide--D-alanyl-D-alanine ligase [Terricaulis sp.]
MSLFGLIAAFLAYGLFLYRRLPRFLHFFQQDEYDNNRFLRWVGDARTVDTRATFPLAAIAALSFAGAQWNASWVWPLACAVAMASVAIMEPDPRMVGKKPLVMTQRATMIFRVSLALGLGVGVLLALYAPIWGWLIGVQMPPLLLAAANLLLSPLERRTQLFFLNDAKRRLREINPAIIGVTGSFGKTSVKHTLGHILSLADNAYITPGSVNTTMGISRVIRENLPADCRNFVVEMGAYGPGSIARLCDLTPPSVGIITALGEAHYERFKTLDTVARAKFELAESVLQKPGGLMIIHDSVLDQAYARAFVAKHRDKFVVCGERDGADVFVKTWTASAKGLDMTLTWRGGEFRIEAPLFGAHNIGNIAVAFGAAVSVGVSPERVVAALRTAPQTKHRLEVKHQSNGAIVIDDAYNSNPKGFEAALEVLTILGQGKRRRILVTPGMVELGELHDQLHGKLGESAARNADLVIAVRPERIPTFVAAVEQGPCAPLKFGSFAEAKAWLDQNLRGDDVVLLENDLPDLYERKLAI